MRAFSKKKYALSEGETSRKYIGALWPRIHRYLTPRKLLNAARVERESRTRTVRVRGKPYVLHLEPTNICSVRCPYCRTGAGDNELPNGMMSFASFKRIFDHLRDDLIMVRLDGAGEPFINKHISEMISYCHYHGVATTMSTNLQSCDDHDLEEVVRAGLDYLICSIDGTTQEVYEKYRIKGSLEKCLLNLRSLADIKQRLGSSTPFTDWQFLIFDHNLHQVEEVKRMVVGSGADRLSLNDVRPETWKKIIAGEPPHTCYWFYKAINVTYDGHVRACCSDGMGHAFTFGDLVELGFDAVWNGEKQMQARRLFVDAREKPPVLEDAKCVATCAMVNDSRRRHGLPQIELDLTRVPPTGIA